jgi:acyl dehydratase
MAAPAFVWDVAIGQSTLVTQRAIANLFYRGLVFRRVPAIGDSLTTVTTVIGLKPLAAKPDRPPRGLVTMRIETADQDGRVVLDFRRCAMLPARTQQVTAAQGETELPKSEVTQAELRQAISGWNLSAFRKAVRGSHFGDLASETRYDLAGGDVVSSAPELARLTMNLATVHHDRTTAAGGKRLVYGGHTIGLATAQLTRIFPGLVTILAWHDCDHLAPVHEGDTLHSSVTIERCEELPDGGGLAHLRSRVRATDASGSGSDVLDWRLVGLFA